MTEVQEFSACVIVVSDRVSKGETEDQSGALLSGLLQQHGAKVVSDECVADEMDLIAAAVTTALRLSLDLIVTTGGTGLGPRDVTPEAVLPLLESRLPGIEHRIFAASLAKTPTAMLGRPFAGRVGSTIILGLPGAPRAVTDAMEALFPHLKHAFHIMGGGGHN